jgi:hypothetical protein
MLRMDMTPIRHINMEITQANTGRTMKKLGMPAVPRAQVPAGAAGAAAAAGASLATGACQGTAFTALPSRATCTPETITRSPCERPPVTIQSFP